MPFDAINEGSKCVSMTRRTTGLADIARCVLGCHGMTCRVTSAWPYARVDDVPSGPQLWDRFEWGPVIPST